MFQKYLTKTRKKGFTLIEMIVVIAIIAVLIALVEMCIRDSVYPVLLVCVTLGVVIGLFVFVLPSFFTMFEGCLLYTSRCV